MSEIYFMLLTTTFKEIAQVIDFSKGFICFLFRKIPLHRTRILNHPKSNYSTS